MERTIMSAARNSYKNALFAILDHGKSVIPDSKKPDEARQRLRKGEFTFEDNGKTSIFGYVQTLEGNWDKGPIKIIWNLIEDARHQGLIQKIEEGWNPDVDAARNTVANTLHALASGLTDSSNYSKDKGHHDYVYDYDMIEAFEAVQKAKINDFTLTKLLLMKRFSLNMDAVLEKLPEPETTTV